MKTTLVLIILAVTYSASVLAQSSWKSPEYQPENYRKVMVLAKFSDELAKRQLEDATVKLLNDNQIPAIPAYSNIVDADLVSEDVFVAKAQTLEIDGLIVFRITSNDTEYKNTPAVNLNVGVPVRLGIFHGFLGTNVPVAGGAKSVNIVNATASFYNRSSRSIQWSYPLKAKLKRGNDAMTVSFAKTTVEAMIKENMFLK